jgi:hypothetical protein
MMSNFERQWQISLHIKGSFYTEGFIHIYDHVQDTEVEIDVELEFDYQPPEKMTHNYPGCEEELILTGVNAFFGEVDINTISNVSELENEALNILQKGEENE